MYLESKDGIIQPVDWETEIKRVSALKPDDVDDDLVPSHKLGVMKANFEILGRAANLLAQKYNDKVREEQDG